MIPPGTAVRDAHACYEVVVLVTVPDKPRLTSSCLNYHYSPHGRPTRAMHTSADTNGIPLREELLEGTVYYDRQGRQVNIMNERMRSYWRQRVEKRKKAKMKSGMEKK